MASFSFIPISFILHELFRLCHCFSPSFQQMLLAEFSWNLLDADIKGDLLLRKKTYIFLFFSLFWLFTFSSSYFLPSQFSLCNTFLSPFHINWYSYVILEQVLETLIQKTCLMEIKFIILLSMCNFYPMNYYSKLQLSFPNLNENY